MKRLTLASAVAAAFVLTLLSAPPANAHFRLSQPQGAPYRWFFEGVSYGQPNRREVKDPVNILFRGGSAAWPFLDDVLYYLSGDSPSPRLWPRMRMRECLWAYDRVAYDQGMVFKAISDSQRRRGQRWLIQKEQEATWSTSAACHHQWHIRLWSDAVHRRQTRNHGLAGQWAVGGIHHDRRTWLPTPNHRVDRPWEAGEALLVYKLRGYFCSYRNWRFLPGSQGRFQGYASNGRISMIWMTRPRTVGNPDHRQECP
jgi:hypothetical protein